MNETATEETALSVHRSVGGGALLPSSFGDAVRFAELMCKASLVPQHLQGKPADCLLVIEQAQRWGLSPFAVAACTSVISGKLMFEGKLVAAVINARGELQERLSFEYVGDGNARTVTVSGRLKGEREARTIDVRLADAKTTNRMWQTQPDQQLAYHGARVWARRHMPELMLGIYAPEEMETQAPKDQGGYSPPSSTLANANTAEPSDVVAVESIEHHAATVYKPASDDELLADDAETLEEVPIYENKGSKQKPDWQEVGRAEKRTLAQNKEIHALRGELKNKFSDVQYRKHLQVNYNKNSSAELSKDEAMDHITRMRDFRAKQWAAYEKRGESTTV